jgi:RNA polymerase sigma-70 factor (TIGR02960 family)
MGPMNDPAGRSEAELLAAAGKGDSKAFDRLVARYRRELGAHCYRMLGSPQDAEDALQESLLAAWKGLASFEGRSSLRTWLYQVSTNACLRLISSRPRRLLSPEHGPPRKDTQELGEAVTGPVWLEPWPDDVAVSEPAGPADPAGHFLLRESIELAFIAALQHLPGTQRAVLILREVLELSAAEVAEILDTTVASVNSALQRARKVIEERVPPTSQRSELAALGPDGRRTLEDAFVSAWERADVPALLQLLAADAQFTMPPLPAWYDGREDVGRFLTDRVFATPWRLVPLRANGQLGFACYILAPGAERFRLGAVNLLRVRAGLVAQIAAFLDPTVHRHFGLPAELPAENRPADR